MMYTDIITPFHFMEFPEHHEEERTETPDPTSITRSDYAQVFVHQDDTAQFTRLAMEAQTLNATGENKDRFRKMQEDGLLSEEACQMLIDMMKAVGKSQVLFNGRR